MSVSIQETVVRPFAASVAALAIAMAIHGSAARSVFGGQAETPEVIRAAPNVEPKADSKVDPSVDAAKTGRDADALLEKLLPPRSDTMADWHASVECLHGPGEPRALRPCVPPPPCDPSHPPRPFDLVGVHGQPTCGPIYRGPCEPRSGRHHHGVFAWYHHCCDRMFDRFYRSK